jgi:hypothetical protein
LKPDDATVRDVREILSNLTGNVSSLMNKTINLLNTVTLERKNRD